MEAELNVIWSCYINGFNLNWDKITYPNHFIAFALDKLTGMDTRHRYRMAYL